MRWLMMLLLWQMEQPHFEMADVIVIVADWNSHIGWNVVKADLITLVADGKATGSIYFDLSSVLFIRLEDF